MKLLKSSLWALVFILGACHWNDDSKNAYYQLNGIAVYKGQSISDLWLANGAPNVIKNLDDGVVMWIYYTNFQSVGGGEMISYNIPYPSSSAIKCSVKVLLRNEKVISAYSNCN